MHGQRDGLWRIFHPNGVLAEEAHYDHGKLHGSRRRFFESGRRSLDANYEHGVPTGAWTAFYDRESPNVALTVPLQGGREQQRVSGFLPSGTPWSPDLKLAACQPETECRSSLALLDLDALPPVLPEPCPLGDTQGHGRSASANRFPPILQAARNAWPKADPGTSSLAPMGCVESIRISCATDLDGEPGAEVLAEIAYHAYQPDCAAARRNGVSVTVAVVALSPGRAGAPWSARGLLGFRGFDAPGIESPPLFELSGFVRLPSGEAAVRALESTDGGDCSGGRVDQILLFDRGNWAVVAARTITACNQLAEPDETDHF